MTKRMMFDLETLGTNRNDAPVVAIGAVIFDDDRILHSVGWKIATPWSGNANSDTIQWWMQQSDQARQMVFSTEGRHDSFYVWNEFMAMVQLFQPETVWANDPDFDVVIMQNWLAREQQPTRNADGFIKMIPIGRWPFKYNQYRSYRTLREIAGKAGWTDEMNGAARGMYIAHDPVEDAAAQARAVMAMEAFILNRTSAPRERMVA